MTSLELETLRRQVEEDFKLDLAAIDRLQRRYNEGNVNGSRAASTQVEPQRMVEPQPVVEPQPAVERRSVTLVPAGDLRPQPPDELTDSLRTMFSNYR